MEEQSDEISGSDAVGGASTLLEVLNTLRDRGYDEQLIADDGATMRCTHCNTKTPVAELDVDGFHRLEGASDPADMNLVVWATCPSCAAKGAATLGYGPHATTEDQAVLEGIELDSVDSADDGNAS